MNSKPVPSENVKTTMWRHAPGRCIRCHIDNCVSILDFATVLLLLSTCTRIRYLTSSLLSNLNSHDP